jgi:hypothetical protein
VTIYNYNKDDTGKTTNLYETRTYNVEGIETDFTAAGWKNLFTEDRLTRIAVYKGDEKKEKISYAIDVYFISDAGDNTPHQVAIYDYDAVEGEALDQVRTYQISGFSTEDLRGKDPAALQAMGIQDPGKLISTSVYQGEKDKEKVSYILSDYFDDTTSGLGYRAWTRTDYTYEDKKLTKTEAYNISDMEGMDISVRGSGKLDETTFFVGEVNHERPDYSYTLYDASNVPQLRVDHIYDGRALSSIKTYSISVLKNDRKDKLQDEC